LEPLATPVTLDREIIQIYILNLPFALDRMNAFIVLFYVLNFIKSCSRKLLLSLVVLKMTFNSKVFSTNYMLPKCLGCENLELLLESRQKVFADSLARPLTLKMLAFRQRFLT